LRLPSVQIRFVSRSIAPLLLVILSLLLVVNTACRRGANGDRAGSGGEDGQGATYTAPNPAPTPIPGPLNQHRVTLLDGGNVPLSDLIGGGKVVLVNFWATWCGPCRREIPELIELQKELRAQGVEIVGLTVENPLTERDEVQAFVGQQGINYRIGFAPEPAFLLFNGADPRAPIPQTFIFDRNGRLIDRFKGYRRDFRRWAEGAIRYALQRT
jgi:thiol-disulfide isomerase/thioredoxin